MESMATQSVVNMAYLSLGIGIPVTTLLGASYTRFASEKVSRTHFYRESVVLTSIASVLELSTEPFFAVVQHCMLYKIRAIVEMVAAFAKSITTCGIFAWASWNGYDIGILPFALGHIAYSLVLLCGYSGAIASAPSRTRFSFLLTRIKTSDKSGYIAGMFSVELVSLSANVFFQSVIKHLLTQGDTMMLAAISTLEDQGVYSLASNYGGLVARILFQPIEESSRTLFSSLLSAGEAHNLKPARMHLIDVLRAYGVLSALIFPLGPVMVPQVLHAFGGRRWTIPEVDRLLSLYCLYIPFLAFNGITEAFVSSVATGSELRAQTGWMGAFSACFALAAYTFLSIGNLGARGLVYANMVNMTVRIIWSLSFIKRYFRQYENHMGIAEFSLSPYTYVAGSLMTAITITSPGLFDRSLSGLVQGTIFSALYGFFILYLERNYLKTLYFRFRQIRKPVISTHKAQ
ncbi:Rft domain protein [Aspergillus clavatus NRRL 1]|uniref:Man(5)GlcNAc(2)-PP-dolichol translocation protein RFT1 n=1 Tax=Aspergillus clavatus (strain ATCC 1007 / CBS 513.65 / DSM 816 / NCTC 3887 / NRRL 1 / QM 1276 / 107) TaxID=344612 RepID=A1C5V4_ASPCL|nr:Rft domain protein [Aspergillus clavatus NRRL 1]EAW13775.1 Rft domain protein [Aspergillus clavatus NRRL 1]